MSNSPRGAGHGHGHSFERCQRNSRGNLNPIPRKKSPSQSPGKSQQQQQQQHSPQGRRNWGHRRDRDLGFSPNNKNRDEIESILAEWTESVHAMFKKVVVFRGQDSGIDEELFRLPPINQFFAEHSWVIDDLMRLKRELNEVKDTLDDKEVSPWHQHTRMMNPCKAIQHLLKMEFNPEYCSQAWGKFMEIIATYPVIPETLLTLKEVNLDNDAKVIETIMPGVNSLHLCEAPGAFISAANHFIKTNHPKLNWNWLATTLNPYHEANDVGQMINEDKLILLSSERWTFLKDNTGNIMNRDNIKGLVLKTKLLFGDQRHGQGQGVHFVTADGSIDCQDNPNDQENSVAQLQYAEIVTALLNLAKGGSFVIKIFTFFESTTISHLYLLSCVFKEVKLVKPVMSKEGNSEVYVVCLGYLGTCEFHAELRVLLAHVGIIGVRKGETTPRVLFSRASIPDFFMEKIKSASEFFVGLQMSAIKRNVAAFRFTRSIYPLLSSTQREIAKTWIIKCKIGRLENSDRLAPDMALTCQSLAHVDPKKEITCLTERQEQSYVTFGKINILEDKLKFYANLNSFNRLSVQISDEFKIQTVRVGKCYINIQGSRFCYGKLLLLRDELRNILISNWDAICVWNPEVAAVTQHCTNERNKLKLDSLVAKYRDENNGNTDWSLKTLCYHETLRNLATNTDADAGRLGFVDFIRTIENLQLGESVFLCEFPLLARLHIGIIFVIRTFFEKVTLCYNESMDILGVLLYGFKGIDEQTSVWENLVCIVDSLEDSPPNSTVLECVQMHLICNGKYVTPLLNYNLINMTRSLKKNLRTASTL